MFFIFNERGTRIERFKKNDPAEGSCSKTRNEELKKIGIWPALLYVVKIICYPYNIYKYKAVCILHTRTYKDVYKTLLWVFNRKIPLFTWDSFYEDTNIKYWLLSKVCLYVNKFEIANVHSELRVSGNIILLPNMINEVC